jgi:hypothetical protein
MFASTLHSPPALGAPQLFSPSGVLVQLDMTPQSLTAAGASPEQVELLVGALATASGDRAGLQALLAAIDVAESPQAAAAARAAFDSARESMREELMESLPNGCGQQLATVSEGLRYRLPADLAAVACVNESGLHPAQVKRMLIAERRAQRMGRTLSPQIASALASLRAHPSAIAVRGRLTANLSEIEETFQAGWSDQPPPP